MSGTIQQRIAEVMLDHTHSVPFGFCYCGLETRRDSPNEWADHVAEVLVSELGLTKDGGTIYHRAYRYVTEWRSA